MEIFAVLVVSLLSISGHVLGSMDCPRAEYLHFCTCAGDRITCEDNNNGMDISADMKAIAMNHNPGDQFFEYLEIKSKSMEKLEANAFHGVTFKELKFTSAAKLSCVDPDAFRGMEQRTTRFYASDTSFGSNDPTCNLFGALSSLTVLERINITGSFIGAIPDNAFKDTMNNLQYINLSGKQGGWIRTIGKNAFSNLKNLRYIDLSDNEIYFIDSNAFGFSDYSDIEITINLEHNRGLTGFSFPAPIFVMDDRRATLKLGANPDLQYLNENVFRTYLKSRQNGYNKIDLGGSPLCDCVQNRWLLGDAESKLNLIDKITNARSTDGDSFWKKTDKYTTVTAHTLSTPPAPTTVKKS